MAGPQLTICLWFDGRAEEAARFYTSIFPNSKITNTVRYLEAGKEYHGHDPGDVQLVTFELNGVPFSILNGGPIHAQHTPSTSHVVHCKDQAEVDYYWSKLGEGADDREFVCGWLKDKFGISWQVVPVQLMQMLLSEDKDKAGQAMMAMMGMKKFDVEALEAALDG